MADVQHRNHTARTPTQRHNAHPKLNSLYRHTANSNNRTRIPTLWCAFSWVIDTCQGPHTMNHSWILTKVEKTIMRHSCQCYAEKSEWSVLSFFDETFLRHFHQQYHCQHLIAAFFALAFLCFLLFWNDTMPGEYVCAENFLEGVLSRSSSGITLWKGFSCPETWLQIELKIQRKDAEIEGIKDRTIWLGAKIFSERECLVT